MTSDEGRQRGDFNVEEYRYSVACHNINVRGGTKSSFVDGCWFQCADISAALSS
ncbi:hypothetical protein NEOLEDRAFT_1143680 [Neolentinus lepideus HHB14362 ss-1]|uniref:Uncharacterized protein n=1 Tax=Neolentinus lepideus HHB14362 ss-1 TaxID=1314782 RepID=A0A165MEH4_9AGAM|nr:hypothetical protein NEOLEDRAFT_1143680 [Neolentinus lepideus HHB14362 ss-1]